MWVPRQTSKLDVSHYSAGGVSPGTPLNKGLIYGGKPVRLREPAGTLVESRPTAVCFFRIHYCLSCLSPSKSGIRRRSTRPSSSSCFSADIKNAQNPAKLLPWSLAMMASRSSKMSFRTLPRGRSPPVARRARSDQARGSSARSA